MTGLLLFRRQTARVRRLDELADSLSIYVVTADGTGLSRLTRHASLWEEEPDWSPDGKWIASYSERAGNAEIYVIGADGRHLKRITRDPAYVMYPRWRPTG